MGEREKQELLSQLIEANKQANKPIANKIVMSSVGVICTIITACVYLGGVLRDVQDVKKWKEDAAPVVAQHTTDITVIKTILKLNK